MKLYIAEVSRKYSNGWKSSSYYISSENISEALDKAQKEKGEMWKENEFEVLSVKLVDGILL